MELTKADIKQLRKALRIADRANDYEVTQWALGEIEATLDKIETRADKGE